MTGSLEQHRQHELHELAILDTEPEHQFDELVNLASTICDTAASAFTLVDADRVWIKAAKGPLPKELPREVAFCSHMIEANADLLITDASQDERFCHSPLVACADGIRFYAGFPVRAASGLPMGGLCVIDTKPRHISAQQQTALAVIARQIGARLELLKQRRAAEAAVVAMRRYQLELEEANHRLRQMSFSDSLTGLANRRAFEERLAAEVAAAQTGSHPLSLLMIDVDNFKRLNDLFGHSYGDQVLQRVALSIARSTRMLDLTARYGGEEFAVLMPGASSSGAISVAERIQQELELEHWNERPVTVSIGIAGLEWSATAAPTLVACADLALYEAKARGKNQFVLHHSGEKGPDHVSNAGTEFRSPTLH